MNMDSNSAGKIIDQCGLGYRLGFYIIYAAYATVDQFTFEKLLFKKDP